mgnify:CR=1 FL=1
MFTEQNPIVSMKGVRDGLLVTLGEGEWPDIQEALLNEVKEKRDFLKGARLALDVGNRVICAADMGTLRDRLSDLEVNLWAVLSSSTATEQTAQTLGLATRITTPRPERTVRPMDTHLEGENAIFVQRTLRSGFKVETRGHVVVLGDVNPGAEVIAGGNVIVWGRLRGMVHAGAEGDESAVVCALDLNPTQLRIAGLVAVSPQKTRKPRPEVARVHEGQVIAEAWNIKD